MVLTVSVVLLAAGPAFAADCPTEVSSLDARVQAVRQAPTCKQSLQVMQACAYGASGDVQLGAVVVETCEAEFLAKLSKARRRGYDWVQKRCDDEYGVQSGTMYRSITAFCHAGNAVRYAGKYGAPARRK